MYDDNELTVCHVFHFQCIVPITVRRQQNLTYSLQVSWISLVTRISFVDSNASFLVRPLFVFGRDWEEMCSEWLDSNIFGTYMQHDKWYKTTGSKTFSMPYINVLLHTEQFSWSKWIHLFPLRSNYQLEVKNSGWTKMTFCINFWFV